MQQENSCPICASKANYKFSKGGYHLYRCVSCDFGHLNPAPTLEEVNDFYNSENYYQSKEKGYANYDELEEGLKSTYSQLVKGLHKEYAFDIKDKKVLDVGCAYGYFLDVAKELGASELTGTDLSKDSAVKMKEKGYVFYHGPFENIDLGSNTYDLIFMGDVFEHLMDPFAVLEKIKKVLNPGGLVLITTVDFASVFVKWSGVNWRLFTPPEHIQYWSPKSIKTLFSKYEMEGDVSNYNIYLPKSYIQFRFKKQFGFQPFFMALYPKDVVPIPGFDVMKCVFRN